MRTSLLLLLLSTLSLPLWAANILVISSYHPEYLWDQSYNKGLLDGLQGEHKITHFYMDTKRHPREKFDEIAQQAIAFYLKSKPDLVVLGDDNAINYLANEIASLGTPVVFLGMNENPRLKGFVGHPKITGVLERPLLKRNISEISQMMGGSTRRWYCLIPAMWPSLPLRMNSRPRPSCGSVRPGSTAS